MSLPSYLANSPKGLAMAKLRRMVSMSTAFQSRCGESETGCLERCHFRSVDADASMPFALIGVSRTSWRTYAGGSQNHMKPSGAISISFWCEPSADYSDTDDQRHEAEDFFDAVMQEVAAMSAADDPLSEDGTSHLAINDIDPDGDVEESPEQTQATTGRFFWGRYMVTWGYEG